MPKVNIYTKDGTVVGHHLLDDAIFGVPVKETLIHQVVMAHEANARVPLAHTKTKGEVRGGGKKPWRQKGTGRARQGSIRAPQWRGGGVVFGPRQERNHSVHINKKMKHSALLMSLSDKVSHNHLIILDSLAPSGKTKDWQSMMKTLWAKLAIEKKRAPSTLVIMPSVSLLLRRSVNNLQKTNAVRTDSLNVPLLLRHDYALITVDGVKELTHWLKRKRK